MDERINAEFGKPVVVNTSSMDWVASPLPGVERRMLDRVGGEVARATSIVRYAAGSAFSAHVHEKGEEFLVLEGIFSDEHGDYPAGSYIRNPPGTRHAPHSDEGCVIFVKLRQFADDDLHPVSMDTRNMAFAPTAHEGVSSLLLHEHGDERVRLLRLAPGTSVAAHEHPGGEEILVLEGGFCDGVANHEEGTWIRNPAGSSHAVSTEGGALLYIKTGHLGKT